MNGLYVLQKFNFLTYELDKNFNKPCLFKESNKNKI